MFILGLSHLYPSPVGHDTTAAIAEDGIIKMAVSEERFSRVKHYAGYPSNAIRSCLNESKIRLLDVNKVAVGFGLWDKDIDYNVSGDFFQYPINDNSFRKTSIEKINPRYYDHQYIHARTGYSMSGFKKAVIISMDAAGLDSGQNVSGGIFIADNGKIDVLKLFPHEASLGRAYGSFTEACGFAYTDGEGKTMCLAAVGEKEGFEAKKLVYESIKKIFPKFKEIEYVGGGLERPNWKIQNNVQIFSIVDKRVNDISVSFKKEIIAWAAQTILQEILVDLVSSIVNYTKIKNVVLTGGVFFNMIANMMIREKLNLMNCKLFVNPVCGDMGNALGAIFEECFRENGKYNWESQSMFLGPEFDNEYIKSAIQRYGFNFSSVDKESKAEELLNDGKIIGWFQGKAELGPRGLGNRSILARVEDSKFKDLINKKVKHREEWRPFCPTIIKEKSDYYLHNSEPAPYMIMGFRVKHTEEIPAVVHIDNTTRPQILSNSENPSFYKVVKNVGGIVLNTSLNLAGDPINTFPEDALMTLKYSHMDGLIIGDYFVTKN